MLSSVYKEKLVCIAVDEAHCIKVWGAEFRPTFAEIGNLRSIIPSSMGVDYPNIRIIIHWGLPTTLEEYVQETGRSSRDGENAVAILYRGVGGRKATAKVKAYVENEVTCRRCLLFQDFYYIQRVV